MKPETLSFIESCIKTIPDYPKPGIMFRDIAALSQRLIEIGLTLQSRLPT